ncbi:MAG: 3-oxoacyl-ACP reductase FabG [Eubacteriales bacterium]
MEKKILITGASGEIGRAIALEQGKEGYHLACCYHRHQGKAQALQAEIRAFGGVCEIFSGDLASHSETTEMTQKILRDFGTPDGIVLNAGISHFSLFQDTTPEAWERVMDVNLHSFYSLLKVALPSMISRQRGNIVTISSIWGQVGASCEVAYATSKAGVIGLTKALAVELAPSGLRVNAVAPGMIETEMNGMLSEEEKQCFIEKIPLGRVGTVEEVAQVVSFLLSEKSSYLTGQVLAVNGGQVV